MNLKNIENVIKHLQKECDCLQCQEKFDQKNIHAIATTEIEGLFEAKCPKCGYSTIINVALTKENEGTEITSAEIKKDNRSHEKISPNDILDIKNFLANFDGNFKKIFEKRI